MVNGPLSSDRKKPGAVFWATVVVVVVAVYVLSFGPVYCFAQHYHHAGVLLVVYRPLLALASVLSPLSRFLLWWSSVFGC